MEADMNFKIILINVKIKENEYYIICFWIIFKFDDGETKGFNVFNL